MILTYAAEKLKEKQENDLYKIYISDALWAISNHSGLKERYYDLYYTDQPIKPKMTAAEAKAGILSVFQKMEVRK